MQNWPSKLELLDPKHIQIGIPVFSLNRIIEG